MMEARHVRNALFLATLGLAALLAHGDARDARIRAPQFAAPNLVRATPAVFERAITGESILVNLEGRRERIRLLGVAAPPLTKPAGRLARLALEHLLQGEELLLLVSDDARAETDARAAYVHRSPDGLFVNLEMIRQGYAEVDVRREHTHAAAFAEFGGFAKAAGKGIWGADAAGPANLGPLLGEAEGAAPPGAPIAAPLAGGGDAAPDAAGAVYVTKSGKKYHRVDCQHVRRGGQAMSLAAAQAKGMTACSRCKP